MALQEGVTCTFCKTTIDPDQDYQRIRAWRKRRSGGNSANYVRLIEFASEWACQFCIGQRSKGRANQGSLF